MKKTLLLASALLVTYASQAQPYIDSLNIMPYQPSSAPSSLITNDSGTVLYFAAQENVHGREMWSMSPTDTFPNRITDINPGSIYSVQSGTDRMFYMDGTIYYAGYDTALGTELFSYKPGQTTATLLKDIDTNPRQGSFPVSFNKMNGKLYFSAKTLDTGHELWEHDPAANTTRALGNLNPGRYDANPRYLTPFQNKLYFQGTNTNTGVELYVFDPVADSIRLVADIEPGPTDGNPLYLLEYNGKLYFIAQESTAGTELYEYDGTNNPKRITDIAPGADNGVYNPANLTIYNNKIFFSGFDANTNNFQLHSYDPSNGNVTLEATINPSGISSIRQLIVYGTKLFFTATGNASGQELWSFDGSTAKMEADIYQGSKNSNITELAVAGTSLYFAATNETYGTELFRYSLYPLSIEQPSTTVSDIKLYPNPAHDNTNARIELQKSETLSIIVTDMQGRVVYNTVKALYSKGTHNINIPLSNLPSGNYLYQLRSDSKTLATGKLIKQ